MKCSRRLFLKALGGSAVAASLSGCKTTQTGWFNPATSMDAAELSTETATAIAEDMVAPLSEHLDVGRSTIALRRDASEFGLALDKSLRASGYAVIEADQEVVAGKVVPLAYTIQSDTAQILVRITTPTVELSRSYQTTMTGAASLSPISILTRST
ncbi:conjugal transfer protein TrbH [Roseibium alexandrii]|uniref:conjugal transfer protein TrbH n=1 Tax=Roseibium alexandrii TaxID=388408 RepID=UPI003750F498